MPAHTAPSPIQVALVNDYEVVVAGLAGMLAPYADRVAVVELDANTAVGGDVDIALYDTYAHGPGRGVDEADVLANCRAQKLVLYTWDVEARRADAGADSGVDAYLPKRLPAAELVTALERIADGSWDHADAPVGADTGAGSWPGQDVGLSERESEVLALIVRGLSNQEVADRAYLSINTVKSYIRGAYRKIEVTTRSQAVLWGIDHGFRPDRVRERVADRA